MFLANAELIQANLTLAIAKNTTVRYYCIEGTEMRQLGFKVRRLLFLNRY